METFTRCPHCDGSVPTGRFCAACGQPLQAPASEKLVVTHAEPASEEGTTAEAQVDSAPTGLDVPIAGTPTLSATGFQRLTKGSNRTVGIAAVTVALLATAAYALFGTSEKHTVTGDLALTTANSLSPGDTCLGTGGYSDIHEGTQVIIEDDTGRTLATGDFGTGLYDGRSCVFSFSFKDVPKAKFYRVHQSGDRGTLQYSYSDMVGSDWSVHLTLGDG